MDVTGLMSSDGHPLTFPFLKDLRHLREHRVTLVRVDFLFLERHQLTQLGVFPVVRVLLDVQRKGLIEGV